MNIEDGFKFNKFTLLFDTEKEIEYQDSVFRKSLKLIRIEYFFVIFLYAIFSILDNILVPEHAVLFFQIRFFVVIPILFSAIILSYFKFFKVIWQYTFSISFLFVAQGITLMIIKVPDNYSYYLGLMLVFSGNYFLSGLKFKNATIVSFLNLLVFNILFASNSNKDILFIIAINFFYVSQILINAFVGYVNESTARKNYILKNELNNERDNLEKQVMIRTKELNDSEVKFRTIANFTADWEYWIGKDNKIIYMNPACEQITGYSSEEFEKKPNLLFDLIIEEDLPNWIEHHRMAHDENSMQFTQAIVFRIVNKFNKSIYIEHNCRPVFNELGEFIGRRVSNRDVSERMSLEIQLRKDQMFIKNILGSLPGVFLLYTYPEMKLILWNKNFEWVFGYTKDELANKIGLEWFIDKPIDKINQTINTVMENGFFAKEETVHTKFGEQLNYILSGRSFEFKDEKYLIGFGIDITDRIKAEATLTENETKQRAMIENIADVISIIDNKFKVKYISPNISSIFGWDPNEIISKNALEKIYFDDHTHIKDFYNNIINKPDYEESSSCRYICKDNSIKWIEFTAKNLIHDQIINGLLVNFRDITDRKIAEQELIKAKEKAEESNHLKTAFLDNIRHEIRTPINGIMGFLSYIKEYEIEQDEKDEMINIINSSLMRLISTIDSIVEISQIQKGQLEIKKSTFNIQCIVDVIYDKYYSKATNKHLVFEINNYLTDSDSQILSDQSKILSTVSYLVDNAIKFTSNGSITLSFFKDNNNLIVKLEDTGIGIEGSKIDKIFESFVQADGSNTRSFEGTGLGLTLAKAYIELLGGKIWVNSEVGIGSTFWFSLPI